MKLQKPKNATIREINNTIEQHHQPHHLDWHWLQYMLSIVWRNVKTSANHITPQLLSSTSNGSRQLLDVSLTHMTVECCSIFFCHTARSAPNENHYHAVAAAIRKPLPVW